MSRFEQLLQGQLPKLVMFDLDGTLIDSVPDLAAAVETMLQTLGRAPAGLENVKMWIGNGAPNGRCGPADCGAKPAKLRHRPTGQRGRQQCQRLDAGH